jgi:hypothetical protein
MTVRPGPLKMAEPTASGLEVSMIEKHLAKKGSAANTTRDLGLLNLMLLVIDFYSRLQ